MRTIRQSKRALSQFDSKRRFCRDPHETRAYGHYRDANESSDVDDDDDDDVDDVDDDVDDDGDDDGDDDDDDEVQMSEPPVDRDDRQQPI